MHFARVLGSIGVLGLCVACRAAVPELVDQSGAANDEPGESTRALEPPATDERVLPGVASAAVESQPGSETGGSETGGSETGGSETGGSESETSETGGSETGARLCSRPYSLSGSPGKGAGTRESAGDSSKYEAATRRLERGLEVSIGEGPGQPWTTKLGVEFDGLDPSARHTVEIVDAQGKRMKSLVLDFEARGSEELCLGFNDFYGTWQLRALRSGQRCGPCVTDSKASSRR